jgi:hypothetical protein
MKPGPVPVCVGQFGGAAIAEPLAAKIATAEQAASSADVDFPPRNFIVSHPSCCLQEITIMGG